MFVRERSLVAVTFELESVTGIRVERVLDVGHTSIEGVVGQSRTSDSVLRSETILDLGSPTS